MCSDFENELELSRNDKIKALGFLCYNLFVDGTAVFPEMNGKVEDIQNHIEYLNFIRQSISDYRYVETEEKKLDTMIIELGCICYNLYIDKKLFPDKVLVLCNDIADINKAIKSGEKRTGSDISIGDILPPFFEDDNEQKRVTEDREDEYPFGMEPIPVNFKECLCGYRNRIEAKYCARCGAKLHA